MSKNVSYKDWMMRTLNKMLKPGEKLQYPVYGTLFRETNSVFGFFGFTKEYLLIALLNFRQQTIGEAVRIKLDVKEVKIRKTWTGQYLVAIVLEDGESVHFRISKRVVGIDCQKENAVGFIEHLAAKYGA